MLALAPLTVNLDRVDRVRREPDRFGRLGQAGDQPEFTPMWMVYPDPAQLPSIGLALMRCYAPGLTVARAARIAAGLRASARTTKTSVR